MERLDPVTVVVSRKVKPGREADYEQWIRGVTDVALKFEGHLGMNVFRPERAGDPYVLVYKFASGKHLDAWLHSEERARWVKQAEELTTETHAEHVSGLESWFTLPGQKSMVPPPRWKMALVTGVAVFAMGQLLGPAVKPLGQWLPAPALSALTTLIMVCLLTWLVMPRLTKLLARWLFVSTK